MPKYRKKPVIIEAREFGPKHQDMLDAFGWAKANAGDREVRWHRDDMNNTYFMTIETLEGVMRAQKGDFIIKGVQGELYPCKADIFNETYEAVEGEPEVPSINNGEGE